MTNKLSARSAGRNGGKSGGSTGNYFLSYTHYGLVIHPRRRVDSQWIVAKKDWREAKKRYKEQERRKASRTSNDQNSPGTLDDSDSAEPETDDRESNKYYQDMDEMRCILYSHGGGPFCSNHNMPNVLKGFKVATTSAVLTKKGRMQSMIATRYSHIFQQIQSPTARSEDKWACFRYVHLLLGFSIITTTFQAINYRLAPQYPFPCAIQDALAACKPNCTIRLNDI